MSRKFEKLGLGTVQFGMHYGIANHKGKTGYNELCKILNYANKVNIDTLDTAKSYGESENVLGKYLSNNPEQNWNVITKVRLGPDSIINQINDTIANLRTFPKAVLAHSKKDYLKPEFYSDLYKLKEKKIVEMVGVSVYNHNDIEEILSFHKPDLIQIPLNILDTRLYLDGTLDYLVSNDINIHIRSVFLQGLFYLSTEEIKSKFPDAFDSLTALNLIAKRVGITVAELSLLWVSSLNFDGKIIIGVDTLDQLKVHLKTLKRDIDTDIFQEAISINYNNEKILNPSLWKIKS